MLRDLRNLSITAEKQEIIVYYECEERSLHLFHVSFLTKS